MGEVMAQYHRRMHRMCPIASASHPGCKWLSISDGAAGVEPASHPWQSVGMSRVHVLLR